MSEYVGFGKLKIVEKQRREEEERARAIEPEVPIETGNIPVTGNSPVTGKSSVTGKGRGGSREIPATGESPVTGNSPATIEIDWKDGHLRLPNYIVFNLYPLLTPLERVVYQELYLWTHGFNRDRHAINQRSLAKSLTMDEKTLRKGVEGLERKGLVVRLSAHNRARNEERATWFEVRLPRLRGKPNETGKFPATGEFPVTGESPVTGNSPYFERNLKENIERSVYEIRTMAARLLEVHRSDPDFSHDRLRDLVRDALIGQGATVDDAAIEDAIRGMAT